MKRYNWGNKDWFWLTGCLIYAGGFSYIWNDQFMDTISYVSTFVSMALAGVAMYISLKEITNAEEKNQKTTEILNLISVKVEQLDNKVDTVDKKIVEQLVNGPQLNILQKGLSNIREYDLSSETKEIFMKEMSTRLNELSNEIKRAMVIKMDNGETVKTDLVTRIEYFISVMPVDPEQPVSEEFINKFTELLNVEAAERFRVINPAVNIKKLKDFRQSNFLTEENFVVSFNVPQDISKEETKDETMFFWLNEESLNLGLGCYVSNICRWNEENEKSLEKSKFKFNF